jgi:multicomponent Na+:H+ antiporter subunit E
MRTFFWNILFALSWLAVTGKFTWGQFSVGFILSYLIMTYLFYNSKSTYFNGISRTFVRNYPKIVKLCFYFLWEIIISNLRVAYYVIMPNNRMKPGIIAVPLDIKTDVEIIMFANMITLTPGTLSLDISQDRETLYVHSIYIDDVEKFKSDLKNNLEKRIQEAFK